MAKIKKQPDPKISIRLRQLMRDNPLLSTQELVAKKSGVGQRTISRILNDEVSSSLPTYQSICAAFGAPSDFLTSDDSSEKAMRMDISSQSQSVVMLTEEHIKQWTGMGDLLENVRLFEDMEFIMTDLQVSKNAHAIKVSDDSMGFELPLNSIAIVEPSAQPARGDIVEALSKTEGVVFRKYKPLAGDGFELVANNDMYSALPSSDIERIVGVVIEHRVRHAK